MNNPLGVSPREPHEVKKKSFDLGGNRTHDLRIRSTFTLPTELRGRTEKVEDDLGGDSRRRENKGTLNVVPFVFLVLRGTTSNVPLLSLRRDSPPKSSPTFSVRPCSSVGRVISDFHITHNAFGFPHKILHKLLSSILKCI